MKRKLSLQDFTEFLIQRENLDRKSADAFVRAFFDVIEEGLYEDRFVKIKGFGTFKLVAVSDRESVNINTGERFQISGHTKVSFTPDNTMKELVNRPFAHFEAVDLNDDTDTTELEEVNEDMLRVNDELAETEETETEETTVVTGDTNASSQHVAKEAEEIDEEQNKNASSVSKAEPVPNVTSPTPITTGNTTNDLSDTTNDLPDTNGDTTYTTYEPTAAVPYATGAAEGTEAQPETVTEEKTQSASLEKVEVTEGQTETPTAVATPSSSSNDAPNNVTEDEDIVVNGPTPISVVADNNASNTMGYTYNEVPSLKKHNWWKTAVLFIGVLFLMSLSYFAGYFRLLCPTCDHAWIEEMVAPAPSVPATNGTPKQPVKKVAAPVPSQPKATADTAQRAAQIVAESKTEPKKADAETAKAAMPKRPVTHTVVTGDNIYRIARKYYGSDDYAQKIIEYNKLKDANTIIIGMELKLP